MIPQKDQRRKTLYRNKMKKKDHTMFMIAVEGLDKSGKHTATNILTDYFSEKGLNVEQMSFPNYESPVGSLLDQWLHGRLDADEKTFELLQAADKQWGQAQIKAYEKNGVDVLLIDRYIHSQWAYGAYDNDDRWLKELTRYMRTPDVVLYLDVEPEVSMHRRGKYGDNDYYESDIERLRYTKNEYFCLFEEMGEVADVRVINANQPQVITKADIVEAAGTLYQEMTGKKVGEGDAMQALTKEEANIVRQWSQVTVRESGSEKGVSGM